jgi:hypothetical protein
VTIDDATLRETLTLNRSVNNRHAVILCLLALSTAETMETSLEELRAAGCPIRGAGETAGWGADEVLRFAPIARGIVADTYRSANAHALFQVVNAIVGGISRDREFSLTTSFKPGVH